MKTFLRFLKEKNDFESVPSDESEVAEDSIEENTVDVVEPNPMSSSRKSILDRWVEKFKEFLDNA